MLAGDELIALWKRTKEDLFLTNGTIATSPTSFFKYDFWGRTSLSFDGEEKKTFPRKCKNSLPLQSDKRLSLRDFYFGFFPLWPGSALGGSEVLYIFYIHTEWTARFPLILLRFWNYFYPSSRYSAHFYTNLIFTLELRERCASTYFDNCYFKSVLFYFWKHVSSRSWPRCDRKFSRHFVIQFVQTETIGYIWIYDTKII